MKHQLTKLRSKLNLWTMGNNSLLRKYAFVGIIYEENSEIKAAHYCYTTN